MPASGSDADEWSPTPLGLVISGVATIAFVKLLCVTVVLAIVNAVMGAQGVLGHWLLIGAGAVVVVDALALVARRRIARRRKHDDPGSLGLAVLLMVAAPIVVIATGVIVLGPSAGLVPMLLSLGMVWASLVFLERPWRDGFTRSEVAERWVATKEMSREVFADEIDDYRQRCRDRERRRRGS